MWGLIRGLMPRLSRRRLLPKFRRIRRDDPDELCNIVRTRRSVAIWHDDAQRSLCLARLELEGRF
eukprot:6207466-Pleurochrysis_carterae.AAC.4